MEDEDYIPFADDVDEARGLHPSEGDQAPYMDLNETAEQPILDPTASGVAANPGVADAPYSPSLLPDDDIPDQVDMSETLQVPPGLEVLKSLRLPLCHQ